MLPTGQLAPMRSSPPLPAAVSAELARLEAKVGQATAPWALDELAGLGEADAVQALRRIGGSRTPVRDLSRYIGFMVKETVALKRNAAAATPDAESAVLGGSGPASRASTHGPCYQDDVQMEVQSPYGEATFGLSNQARIDPASPARQFPACRLPYQESPPRADACILPDRVGMEVESPPGWTSPPGCLQNQSPSPGCLQNQSPSPGFLQHQSPFSAVASPIAANRGRSLEHEMNIDGPSRDFTPSPVRDITRRVQQMGAPSGGRVVVATPQPSSPAAVDALRAAVSPQMLALGELEFHRFFLIRVYLADKKIEDVLDDVNYIRHLKSLSMDEFESEIWRRFGQKFVPASDRRKNIDWDPNKSRIYHCNVVKRGDSIATIFKGPYVEHTRTHLQKVILDDNVLVVKFTDIDIPGQNRADNFGIYCTFYSQVAEHGILLGLRRYRYFIHKDGGKEERQKEENKKEKNKKFSPAVRCYFVRTESLWNSDEPYALTGCTVDQARRLFMHIHTAPTVAKYLSRFTLILSKTIKLDVDLLKVHVETIDDEPCKDEFREPVITEYGEHLIHTDGTGLISADLARKCPTCVFKGNFLKDAVDSNGSGTSDHPLLVQFRMFHNGSAVKGTLLVDKRLPRETIRIRPSMIKINADPKLFCRTEFNSLEIITTSNRPKGAHTSRFLIALLCYGRVKAGYFLELLGKALEGVAKARHKARESLEVAVNHADLDDSMSARMILAGIQPENEAYLQSQLDLMIREERKGLQQGKIPIDECYYLMGTTDPTGTLKPDQVCVILDHGQVSGKVLVYKHPGLHFGDIHILTATYIDGLEKIVGNSKYAILFPTSGGRSLADEMANSDFDGDMYWVSRNPKLLEEFKQLEKPWKRRIPPQNSDGQKKPQDYTGPELESLLFHEFLKARFNPSSVMGAAADCWLALMDRLLTCHVSKSEQESIKKDMLDLVDIYYEALDASKSGNKISIPEKLKTKLFPHYMEREPKCSYKSTSVLGQIYDIMKAYHDETAPEIKISPLECFTEVAVPEECKCRWTRRYQEYLNESSSLFKVDNDKQVRNFQFRALYQKYKQFLYGADEFDESPRSEGELFTEACAIYQVVYERAMEEDKVGKCGFAWKVAGRALCRLYAVRRGGDTALCSFPVLEDAFSWKNRRA